MNKKPADDLRTVRIAANVTKATAEHLQMIAKQEDRTLSYIIGAAVEEYCDNHERYPKARP
jgi:predicted transcriptional regulator